MPRSEIIHITKGVGWYCPDCRAKAKFSAESLNRRGKGENFHYKEVYYIECSECGKKWKIEERERIPRKEEKEPDG